MPYGSPERTVPRVTVSIDEVRDEVVEIFAEELAESATISLKFGDDRRDRWLEPDEFFLDEHACNMATVELVGERKEM